MIGSDLTYVRGLLEKRLIKGPVLELGTGYEGDTCDELIRSAGLNYMGTDLIAGPKVDFVADFEKEEQMAAFASVKPFGAILILNVLEHTFDPIRVLDNAASLLSPGGALVVLTPTVWPLHNFPMDTWRIMPNFYEEYGRRRDMELVSGTLEFVGFGDVSLHRSSNGPYALPRPARGRFRYWYGKILHKALNSFGREMFHPSHVATAAVLRARA